MTEQPTVKEPIGEPTRTSESASDDIAAKLKELKIDSSEKLENVARASSEAGRLANMVGELKTQNEQLMNELRSSKTPTQEYEYGEPSVDLEAAVRRGTRAEVMSILKEQQENQKKAQEAYYRDMSKVQGDKRYKALEEPWQKHMNNPNVQMRLQNGQTTIVDEYYKIKDAYIDILEDTYKNKVEKITQPPSAPHMESGETETVPIPKEDPHSKEELAKKVSPDKGWVGTDENIKDMFNSMFGKDDPFMKTTF